jgi:hypothetical protein
MTHRCRPGSSAQYGFAIRLHNTAARSGPFAVEDRDSMSVERIQQHFRDSAAVKLEALETLSMPIAAAIDTMFGACQRQPHSRVRQWRLGRQRATFRRQADRPLRA